MKKLVKILLVVIAVFAIMIPILLTGRTERVQRTRIATRIVERQEVRPINNITTFTESNISFTYTIGYDFGSLKTITSGDLSRPWQSLRSVCPFSLFMNNLSFTYQYSANRNNWSNFNWNNGNFSPFSARYIRIQVSYNGSISGVNLPSPTFNEQVTVREQEQYEETYWEEVEVPDPTPTRPGRGGGIQRR